jgi:DNA-binding winged helix-turn-helix (wHTH) protein/Tol biopolymer transport system component
MPLAANQLYEFGPFRIDPARNLLLRNAQPVPLTSKAFETLLVLIELRDQVVSKDELMKRVWPDTFVEESNLTQHISMVRKALGVTSQDRHYILTLPGRGYRFTEKIRVISEDGTSLALDPHPAPAPEAGNGSSRTVIFPLPAEDPPAALDAAPRISKPSRFLLGMVGILLLVFAIIWLRPAVPAPSVVRIRQLTHVADVRANQVLVTDGPRIYFLLEEKGGPVLRYVSAEGGGIFPLRTPFPLVELKDVSPNGTELYMQEYEAGAPARRVWRMPLPEGSPQQIGDLRADDSSWSRDGKAIAYVLELDNSLNVAEIDGSNRRKLMTFAGTPSRPRWSPDGRRIRLSVYDSNTNGDTLWEADVAKSASHPLLPHWSGSARVRAGRWTEDGRYFLFSAMSEGVRNIWAMRDQQDLRYRSSNRPVQLTVGPLSFFQPTPSKDGKTIFAIGEQARGQLMRYNRRSQQFEPFAGDLSADQVVFSRDGQSIAYVEYPTGNLFRSRSDGSNRQQLTFSPLRALSPHWSPDGTQLAFNASVAGGARKIYVISATGGTPHQVLADVPGAWLLDWSADGTALLISSINDSRPSGAFYWADLRTSQMRLLDGSEGMTTGLLSPDGHYIATQPLGGDPRLLLYDTDRHSTRLLTRCTCFPSWSGNGILYFGRITGGEHEQGLYRVNVVDGSITRVAAAPGFRLVGVWGVWSGTTPDGALLLFRDASTRDIYALDTQIP